METHVIKKKDLIEMLKPLQDDAKVTVETKNGKRLFVDRVQGQPTSHDITIKVVGD